MKRIFYGALAVVLLGLSACGVSENSPTSDISSPQLETLPLTTPSTSSEVSPPEAQPPLSEASVVLSAGGKQFIITLQDNEAAHALTELLPLTLDMSELNGNEKYFYLNSSLPTDSFQPGQINAGDLMLYGDSCLVLFYESFSSRYSYTRLGSVDDPTGLAEALGTSSAEVTFSVRNSG